MGIMVIVFGLLVNIASILQYRRGMASLRSPEFIEGYSFWLH
jgi:putative membrane protein